MSALRRAFLWCFTCRRTGRIVVGQFPNLSITLFGIGSMAEWLLAPEGQAGAVLRFATRACLAWWAADELLRGVNPWRRMLGAGVLVYLATMVWGRFG